MLEGESLSLVRALAGQAFSRAAGAPLIAGNRVRLLRDGKQNYPAWLDAIGAARQRVHFENYIFREDETGAMFAEALARKAAEGVPVRIVYDWLGGFGKTSRAFWRRLRDRGAQVRCYNPPRLDAPLGWLSRDHRKMLAVDGEVGFVTGLCVGRMWAGVPEQGVDPWRDTGIEVRGPAVAEIERAFAQIWATLGAPLPAAQSGSVPADAGEISLRIVASMPETAGLYRLDQLVAALARHRLWLTDAYYAGTIAYVQALRAAAKDGVDVRLLLPNATDVPLLRPLSRAGYRPLLEAGVRVFEWNGTMLHAKTAVADGRWGRVGSSNLNPASWLGNCELDAVIEDEGFAREMEAMYLEDLANATEVVLDAKQRVRATGEPRPQRRPMSSGGGSAGRAAAGAMRIGHAVGAAFTGRRVLEPVEARLQIAAGAALLALAALLVLLPPLLAYPLGIFLAWVGVAFLCRGYGLYRKKGKDRE
ncbi:MAG: cardiolipin synthase B [Burkholderiales bacterium]|nr:cardiolipin synthase B [Burkholderiales bacterium]